jgi:hypothetical protein
MRSFLHKRVLISLTVGAGVGSAFLYLSILAFVDSSNTALGESFFPYAVVADPSLLSWTVLTLSLIQFPLYGVILGMAWARRRRTLMACIFVILSIHLVAAFSAQISRANYLERITPVPSQRATEQSLQLTAR